MRRVRGTFPALLTVAVLVLPAYLLARHLLNTLLFTRDDYARLAIDEYAKSGARGLAFENFTLYLAAKAKGAPTSMEAVRTGLGEPTARSSWGTQGIETYAYRAHGTRRAAVFVFGDEGHIHMVQWSDEPVRFDSP